MERDNVENLLIKKERGNESCEIELLMLYFFDLKKKLQFWEGYLIYEMSFDIFV